MKRSPDIPVVTGVQMAAVDQAMVAVCGLELLQVMETAGRAVAVVVRHLKPGGSIAILCGSGGNGGDGLVCARYLAGWGFGVQCWLTKDVNELHGLAAHQLQICEKIGIPIAGPETPIDFAAVDLVVDAIFGFGLAAAPTGRAAQLIEAANHSGAMAIAIDLPSGVDATSGVAYGQSIVAEITVTLGLPKQGLLAGDGPAQSGRVIVADIGIPTAAYASVGIAQTAIFDSAEFITLDGRTWPS